MRSTLLRRKVTAAAVAVGAAVATAATTVMAAPSAGAVINGTPSAPAPWAVQITTFHNIPGTPCTGVVIDPHWVATAAHCGPADPGAYTLGFGNHGTVPGGFAETALLATPMVVGAFGSSNTGSLGRHTPVAAYHAPAGDLLLLKLRHPAPAQPVERARVDPEPGAILDYHGFGSIGPGPRSPRSAQLLTGRARLDHIAPYDGSWAGYSHTLGGGFSWGDSGAPIFHGDRLVGLHSSTDRDQRRPDGSSPARYQSIPALSSWIDRIIATR